MSDLIEIDSLFPSTPYFSLGIFGPTYSGKTSLAFDYFKNFGNLYNVKINKVVLYIDILTELHQKIIDLYQEKCEIHHELEINDEIFGSNSEGEVSLVLIDDLQAKLSKSEELTRLVTVLTHHKKLNVTFIGHSIYAHNDSYYRTFLNNLAIFAISLSPRVKTSYLKLMQQIFGIQKARLFDKIFDAAKSDHKTNGSNFPYLFINVHLSAIEEARIFILPFTRFPIIYSIKA